MKNKIYFYLFVFFILYALNNSTGWCNSNSALNLRIELNKEILKLDDPVEVTFIIQNQSDDAVFIVPLAPLHAVTNIEIYDSAGKKEQKFYQVIYDIAMKMIRKKDLIRLRPLENFKFKIHGKISYQRIKEKDIFNKPITGYIIAFQGSSISLKSGGASNKFKIIGACEVDKNDFSLKNVSHLKNLWTGKLTSDEVFFELKNH